MPQPLEFLSEALPGVHASGLAGKLVAVEGPAAVGRSTQIGRLKDWLEDDGYATWIAASPPSQPSTLSDSARALHELSRFARVLELEIHPALKRGLWVLVDGYVFSLIGRMQARGLAGDWLRKAAGFALMPHAVVYLRAKPEDLALRAAERGFGYEESGMDLRLGADRCESFLRYQQRVTAVLDQLAEDYGFTTIDASRPADQVFRQLQRELRKIQ
jgi:dTMP kinase